MSEGGRALTTSRAPCVFCDIVAGHAAASVVYEDDLALAFMDIAPITPGHALVIPKAHYPSRFGFVPWCQLAWQWGGDSWYIPRGIPVVSPVGWPVTAPLRFRRHAPRAPRRRAAQSGAATPPRRATGSPAGAASPRLWCRALPVSSSVASTPLWQGTLRSAALTTRGPRPAVPLVRGARGRGQTGRREGPPHGRASTQPWGRTGERCRSGRPHVARPG